MKTAEEIINDKYIEDIIMQRKFKPLRRQCKRCEKMFIPTGIYQKICFDCAEKGKIRK